MKYAYIFLFLSIGSSFAVSAQDTSFSNLIQKYSQNKRELSKLSNGKAELEKKIEEINKKLSELAAQLNTTREELDSVPENRTTEEVQ